MTRPEKTVFISYRRTNIGYALAVYQNLTSKGYDCFFDYNSIDSGDFEQIILNNIASRAHFVVLLTPSALERLSESGDWLRREMEYAIEMKRNIVPLTMENFDWDKASKYLTDGLEPIKNYNALRVPTDYFMEAMERLSSRHLNVTLDAVIHPRNVVAQQAADRAQEEAESQPQVTEEAIENELSAEEWLQRGFDLNDNSQEELDYYTQAIQLKPDYAEAYNNRGIVRKAQGDLNGAIQDYTESIRLNNSELHLPYNNRGNAYEVQGDLDTAIQDYNQAIQLKPDYADAFINRGIAHKAQGDLDTAIQDYNQAIQLKPDYADAFINRGIAHKAQGDLD
ncbi:MAG: tetratricopeptide repeat protein, partial [Chloroflexota bacterium]